MKLNPFAVATLSLVFAIAACGSDNGGSGSGSGGTDSSGKGGDSSSKGGSDTSGKGGSDSSSKGGSSSSSNTGCINGQGFSCKTSAGLNACFDEGNCDDCSPDASGCGYVSIPVPLEMRVGVPPLVGTIQMWRRSISSALVQ